MDGNNKDPHDEILPVDDHHNDPDVPERRRVIRYVDRHDHEDVEAGVDRSRHHSRSRSMSRAGSRRRNSSVSTVDRLRSRTVEPGTLLPIEYRTV